MSPAKKRTNDDDDTVDDDDDDDDDGIRKEAIAAKVLFVRPKITSLFTITKRFPSIQQPAAAAAVATFFLLFFVCFYVTFVVNSSCIGSWDTFRVVTKQRVFEFPKNLTRFKIFRILECKYYVACCKYCF